MIKLLADQHLYQLSKFLPLEIGCTYYNPQEITPNPEGFNAWLLSTVTKVNKKSYPTLPTSLRYIGTGSSGSNHIDKNYLSSNIIKFNDAKGCNATAVAEYVATALLLLYMQESTFNGITVGIVGVGATGSKVNTLLTKLGFSTILYDPPREAKDPYFISASMEKLLASDVLTFHVPLIKTGEYPTYHWLDSEKLNSHTFDTIINAARGGIIDEKSTLKAKLDGRIHHLIIDVWENEPNYDIEFATHCFIATPHIAGYSVQAKLNASRIITQKLCQFFQLEAREIPLAEKKVIIPIKNNCATLTEYLLKMHPMMEYMHKMKEISTKKNKALLFSKLRSNTPLRHEFTSTKLPSIDKNKFEILKKLGVLT